MSSPAAPFLTESPNRARRSELRDRILSPDDPCPSPPLRPLTEAQNRERERGRRLHWGPVTPVGRNGAGRRIKEGAGDMGEAGEDSGTGGGGPKILSSLPQVTCAFLIFPATAGQSSSVFVITLPRYQNSVTARIFFP